MHTCMSCFCMCVEGDRREYAAVRYSAQVLSLLDHPLEVKGTINQHLVALPFLSLAPVSLFPLYTMLRVHAVC